MFSGLIGIGFPSVAITHRLPVHPDCKFGSNLGCTQFAFIQRIDSVAKVKFQDGVSRSTFVFFWQNLRRLCMAQARR